MSKSIIQTAKRDIATKVSRDRRTKVKIRLPTKRWGHRVTLVHLTFLPPEEVRSGFTDSAFSLLEDLGLLIFSFSAESGESQEGLVLLLFLEESEKRKPSSLSVKLYWLEGAALSGDNKKTTKKKAPYSFRSHPSDVWTPGSSQARWEHPKRETTRQSESQWWSQRSLTGFRAYMKTLSLFLVASLSPI